MIECKDKFNSVVEMFRNFINRVKIPEQPIQCYEDLAKIYLEDGVVRFRYKDQFFSRISNEQLSSPTADALRWYDIETLSEIDMKSLKKKKSND